MKNIAPPLLGALALSVCCGAPLIIGSLSLASISWLVAGPAIAVIVGATAVTGAVLWTRKRRKDNCACEKENG